jgi:LCP family protein required for cell wall assembly
MNKKDTYTGEMLFDDEENYDDDASDYDYEPHPEGAAYAEDDQESDENAGEEYEDDYSDDEGEYENMSGDDAMEKKRKKKNKGWKIALVVELLVAIVLAVFLVKSYINSTFDKMDYTELTDTHVNEDLNEESVKKMTGYTNIALFGIDTRDAGMVDNGVRSDSIIICSINNDTQEVKLVSVYRDTYLELCNNSTSYEKAAHAYAYGGAQGAVNMLNKNLDLNITDYVAVNFTALTEAIDALGGLDIELKESELYKLNQCIDEQIGVNGIQSDHVTTTGVVHLNGVQATAYARIRSTDEGDITRTWRQRTVISKMIEAAKSAGLSKLLDCIDVVVDDVSSSLTKAEIMSLAKNCFDYQLSTTTGFPFTLAAPTMDGVSYVVACDLATNTTALHQFLFEDDAYTPSTTVSTISQNVVNKSGYGNNLDLETFTVEDDVDSIVSN